MTFTHTGYSCTSEVQSEQNAPERSFRFFSFLFFFQTFLLSNWRVWRPDRDAGRAVLKPSTIRQQDAARPRPPLPAESGRESQVLALTRATFRDVFPGGSQKLLVVQQLGVLPRLPEPVEAEVEVHLDHLFACKQTEHVSEDSRARPAQLDPDTGPGSGLWFWTLACRAEMRSTLVQSECSDANANN